MRTATLGHPAFWNRIGFLPFDACAKVSHAMLSSMFFLGNYFLALSSQRLRYSFVLIQFLWRSLIGSKVPCWSQWGLKNCTWPESQQVAPQSWAAVSVAKGGNWGALGARGVRSSVPISATAVLGRLGFAYTQAARAVTNAFGKLRHRSVSWEL